MSYDQGTRRDVASKTLAGVRWALSSLPRPSHEVSLRPSLASRGGSAWSREPPAHQRPGYWCCWWRAGWQNATTNSWVSTCACSSRRTCDRQKDWRCEASSSSRRPSEFLEPRASGHYSPERAPGQPGKTGEYDTSVSLDLARHESLFPILQVLTGTRGERQLLFPFSYTQASQTMEDALKQLRCQRLKISPHALRHGGASEDRAVNARSLEEVQKRGGCESFAMYDGTKNTCENPWLCPKNPARASPARAGTRARPGTTLEEASTRALTGPTRSVGRVFLSLFQHSPSCWHNFENSRMCSTLFGPFPWTSVRRGTT